MNPFHLKNTKPILHSVTPQDLQWDDERIRHQVVVDPRVENLYCAIVRRRGKQRIGRVEVEGSDRPCVVPAERISRSAWQYEDV